MRRSRSVAERSIAFAQPAFTKDALCLHLVPHPELKDIVETLIGSANILAAAAATCRRQWCRLFVPGEAEPYEIPASWAKSKKKKKASTPCTTVCSMVFENVKGTIYGGANPTIDAQLIKVLERMIESEKPMSLVRMSDDAQLWVNAPMVELLQTPAEEATKRVMADFWMPGDLEALKRRIQQEGNFYHRYQGGLNPSVWAKLEGRFELIEADQEYRLATNYYAEPTARPLIYRP